MDQCAVSVDWGDDDEMDDIMLSVNMENFNEAAKSIAGTEVVTNEVKNFVESGVENVAKSDRMEKFVKSEVVNVIDSAGMEKLVESAGLGNLLESTGMKRPVATNDCASKPLQIDKHLTTNEAKKPRLEVRPKMLSEHGLAKDRVRQARDTSMSLATNCRDSEGRLTSRRNRKMMGSDTSKLKNYFTAHVSVNQKLELTDVGQKSWVALLKYLSLDKKTGDCLINQMNIAWIMNNMDKLLTGTKIPFLVMRIFDDGRYQNNGLLGRSNNMTLLDQTGSICAWVDKTVLKELGDVLMNGAAIAVRNVVVVNEKGKLSITLTKDSFQYIATEKIQNRELGVARKNDKMTELAFRDDASGVYIMLRLEKLTFEKLASHTCLLETIHKFKNSIFVYGVGSSVF